MHTQACQNGYRQLLCAVFRAHHPGPTAFEFLAVVEYLHAVVFHTGFCFHALCAELESDSETPFTVGGQPFCGYGSHLHIEFGIERLDATDLFGQRQRRGSTHVESGVDLIFYITEEALGSYWHDCRQHDDCGGHEAYE